MLIRVNSQTQLGICKYNFHYKYMVVGTVWLIFKNFIKIRNNISLKNIYIYTIINIHIYIMQVPVNMHVY